MPASYSEIAAPGVSRWLESIRYKREGWGKYPFNAKSVAPYSLFATGMAIRLLNELNLLENIDNDQKTQAAEYIRASQDQEDGYFKDRFEDVSVYTGFNSWEEIWNQRSSVAHGLRLLGYAPKRSLPEKRFTDLAVNNCIAWLDSLNWENAGKCAEMVSSSMIAYGGSLANDERRDTNTPFSSIFTFFEQEILDPESGLPAKRGASNISYLVTGIARMLSGYIYFGRRFPYPEQIIDFLLDSQDTEGDFSKDCLNMAHNYNSMWILRELNYEMEGSYRDEDIQNAGNVLAHRILDDYRKPDGGFSFGIDSCQDINYSIRISDSHPISDMTGTMMAYRCLIFVDEWNAGIIFGKKRRPFEY